MSFQDIRALWYRMWFQPQSPAPLCLFRILLGLLLILSSLLWLPDLQTWFGYDGIVSVQTMEQFEASNRFSILFWLPPDNAWVSKLYVIMMIAAVTFTLGLRANFSALILFLCVTSFHHRNLLIFNSGHTLMRVCLFLMMFGPIGKMYSIDSWFANWHRPRFADREAERDALAEGEELEPRTIDVAQNSPPILCRPWTQNLLRFQIALVYAQSTLAKMDGETWWNGTAVYYANRMEDFSKFPIPFIFDRMLGYQIATWATLAIEIALWTLIWVKELRYYVLVLGVLLHLGIDWTMNLPIFEHLMIASYVLFLKPEDVECFVNSKKYAFAKVLSFRRYNQHQTLSSN